MDLPFIYSKYVTGKNNIGRKAESRTVAAMLGRGENVVIYEAPKTGKTSLVQQTFCEMRSSGENFATAEISLLSVRRLEDFAARLSSQVLKAAYGDSSKESAPAVGEELKAAISLPYRLARKCGKKIYVVIDEFQNIMLTEDGDLACRLMEEVFGSLDEEDKAAAGYILIGSKINAMHEIFGTGKYFFRQAARVKLGEIELREITEHVTRGMLATGKVIDRGLLTGVCRLLRNNIFYINHFSAICDSLTRGYIMEPVLNEALDVILAVYEPHFIAVMEELTTFQVNLLKAVLDGQTKLTSSEVIGQYGLNSSANVRRLRDALCKKEIITLDDNGIPSVIDPLFEYWLRKRYFEMNI